MKNRLYEEDKDSLWSVIKEDAYNFISSITYEDFVKYCGITPQNSFSPKGAAFIGQDGKFFYVSELAHISAEMHNDVVYEIVLNYLEEKYKDYDKDDISTIVYDAADYAESGFSFGGVGNSLDQLSYRANLVRINDGTTEAEDRFYTVLYDAPTMLQQYALEEFIDWGFENVKDNKLIAFSIKAGDKRSVLSNVFRLSDYEKSSDIVQMIAASFTRGFYIESKQQKKNRSLNTGTQTTKAK